MLFQPPASAGGMRRPFFFAAPSGRSAPRVCAGCGLAVCHREFRYRVERGRPGLLWVARAHPAPCGLPCGRGGDGSALGGPVHEDATCLACLRPEARA